ncbi:MULTISPECIES: FecCD family ABC transporter permease [Lysinibacillus]|uniref:Iron ABC transporter permease n=2 Tax=Lysinibacillus TaxID=400634 RepID=A0A4U2YIJ8_9BACI|nr:MULTISPECIES: iron ABC transporter permease [Lysinibacillus]AHN23630.1 iron ABC transporter permease [Lysinibacillus varians]TKI59471.1 iron ABC transporter permease [Lysinibacillus mangiferihumi]TKI61963.1 iron ABC transporter permease [Lysinibacillus varians]
MHSRASRVVITVITILLLLILGASYLHLTNGVFDMSVMDVLKTLLRIEPNPKFDLVIFEFRLPRIVIAALVGVGLGMAGVVLQGITRNGLADPGILGINAGAGAAVVIFMFFFQFRVVTADISSWLSILMMPIFGFVGGTMAAALIFSFAMKNGHLDMQRLILTGIAINSGFGALSLFLSLKMNAQDYESAAVWMAGSIYNANWIFVVSMLPWLLLLGFYVYRKSYLLDYFQLEEDSITSLGIALEKEKMKLLLASVGLVSACVSVSGSIGFIGLMAPHIAKQLVGIQHRYVMPVSALIGACLLVLADFIGKTVFAPSELAVGIVVSIIGIPYFLYLLVKSKA